MPITIPLGAYHGRFEATGFAIVSDEDEDLAIAAWSMDSLGYVGRNNPKGFRPARRLMHHVVMERVLDRTVRKGMHVDHINGNKLDNRRENLREVTAMANAQNRRGVQRDNTTGYRGVERIPLKNGVAYIGYAKKNKKKYVAVARDTAEEAAADALALRQSLGFATGADPAVVPTFRPTQYAGHRRASVADVQSGENGGNAKLTNEQASEIRSRYTAGGVTLNAIASEYGISKKAALNVVKGRTYRSQIKQLETLSAE